MQRSNHANHAACKDMLSKQMQGATSHYEQTAVPQDAHAAPRLQAFNLNPIANDVFQTLAQSSHGFAQVQPSVRVSQK